MGLTIQRFVIRRLHDTRDYNIEIRDNKIIMVGVNGLGKTTVVTLLFLILSRQWERVLEYDFDHIVITINNQDYVLKQETDTTPVSIARRLRSVVRRSVPTSMYNSIPTEVFDRLAAVAQAGGRDALVAEMDSMLPLPLSHCRKLARDIHLEPKSLNKGQLTPLDVLLKEEAGNYQVLYLPTYRRIEKELAVIFPDLEESVQTFQRHKGAFPGESRRGYIELVEFGMEDVEATFQRARRELVETARSELNGLAGGYLRDVIRGEGENYEIATFNQLDNAIIDRILNRAEEQTLSDTDKARLRAVIEKLKTTPSSGLEPVDRYIAHFFSKLISVDKALSEKEQLIARFTNVCNQYLTGKKMVYDDKDSSISVRLTPSNKPIALKSLSSGEKQIVSLFSHLYLRVRGDVLVIIDEPELSLSVVWQKQLLPHILETGKCHFLAAVTHSPFVFDNALDSYAVNLSECITEAL